MSLGRRDQSQRDGEQHNGRELLCGRALLELLNRSRHGEIS